MAFTVQNSLTNIDKCKKLSALPNELNGCTSILANIIGVEDAVQKIENLYSNEEANIGLIKVFVSEDNNLNYDVVERVVYAWIYSNGHAEQAASLVFFKANKFAFKDNYELYVGAKALTDPIFWDNCWIFFSDEEEYVIPSEFFTAIKSSIPVLYEQIENRQLLFRLGLNCIHQWKIKEAIEDFAPGPFADFLEDKDILLLANEEEKGLVFSLMLDSISSWSKDHFIGSFLKVNNLSFTIFHSFAGEEWPLSKSSIGANATFLGQGCWIEAGIPQRGTNEVLSLSIYPDEAHALKKEEGVSKFLAELGLGEVGSFDIGENFPTLDLAMSYLQVDIGNSGIDNISTALILAVDNDRPGYEVVPGLFTMYDISLEVNWHRGSGVQFTVVGAMNAFTYDFFLSYSYPGNLLQGQLAPGVETKDGIKNLIKSTGAPEIVGESIATAATLFDVSFFASIDDETFEISFKNHETWILSNYITIDSLYLQLDFLNQWSFSGASLFTQLILKIGRLDGGNRENVHIDILAVYEVENNLWTFEGSTGTGQEIPVGEAIDALIEKINDDAPNSPLPDALQSLIVSNIRLYFDSDGNADFICETKLKISEDKEVDFWVHLKRENGELKFAGSIFINGLQLAVAFSSNQQEKNILGSLIFPVTIDTKDLIAALAPDLVDSIPINVAIKLNGLLIGMHMGEEDGTTQQAQKEYLFRLSFEIGFDLSGFPLIGKMLKDIKFTDGQLLAANKDWHNESIQQVNELLEFVSEGTSATAPKPIVQPQQASETTGLAKGISLGGTFQITEAIQFPLFLNFGGSSKESTSDTRGEDGDSGSTQQELDQSPPSPNNETPTKAVSKPDERSQSKVGKVISAVRIQKVGLIFEDGRLGLKITGGLALATFEFELIGLQVTVPQSVLSNPADIAAIDFSLDGFGASIQKGNLSIMGAFMRIEHDTYEEYAGVVQVSLIKFSLAGMGSYAEFPREPKEGEEKHTSLFLFVAIGFPIPIHPSLLIEGMCLGFGIHRDFIPPKMDEILSYPLVQLSITPPEIDPIDVLLEKVGRYFPPTADQYFVVAGIKFKAFGIVKTLAMLAVKFGREFEINLIGVSSIEFPPSLFIELGWQARFVPATGYLFIGGQLTSRSYLLIPEVHITGGFAVAAWLGEEHHGDFVVSVGGYHPAFNVPDHYPDHIPRLGISFELSPLTIKGGVYFAVTPKCLMMGGFLEASLDQGWIAAYLKIHLDAIIYFEPFYYDVMIGVEAGVTATIGSGYLSYDLNLHLNIDVHLWGPEFSGTASIDVGPKTFKAEFGEGGSPKALPLHWNEFENKFLKTADKNGNLHASVCTISVTKGLLRKVTEGSIEYHVIDPKQVEVEVKSLVPLAADHHSPLGITPMDVRKGGYTAQMTVSGIHNFTAQAIEDSVPSGIWGGKGLVQADVSSSDSGLVEDILTGKRLVPNNDEETTETHEIPKEGLKFNIDEFELLDKSVMYQFKELENSNYETPFDKFSEFTGLADVEIESFDKEKLLKSAVLSYELA